jgi:hypothetical protein
MAAIDRAALLKFLKDRSNARGTDTTSGLVITSIYEGLVTRITSGEFDEEVVAGSWGTANGTVVHIPSYQKGKADAQIPHGDD